MSAGKRASIYAILGLGGLVLIFYLNFLMLEANRFGRGNEAKIVLLGAALLIFLASISNFMIAFALSFGHVTDVTGTRCCATLLCDGGIIRERVCIRWVNNLDSDNSDLSPDEKILIFLADWRPTSCTERGFLPQQPR